MTEKKLTSESVEAIGESGELRGVSRKPRLGDRSSSLPTCSSLSPSATWHRRRRRRDTVATLRQRRYIMTTSVMSMGHSLFTRRPNKEWVWPVWEPQCSCRSQKMVYKHCQTKVDKAIFAILHHDGPNGSLWTVCNEKH